MQIREIARWIEEPVRVIDAQSSNPTFADQFENKLMSRLKDNRVFGSNRSQFINIEEPAVIDLIRGNTPKTSDDKPARKAAVPTNRNCLADLLFH